MPMFLSGEEIEALATDELVMAAARIAVSAERDGQAVAPPRLDIDLPRGFLRVMPGAVGRLMGLKVMTLVRGIGNRYLLLVYSQDSGNLEAVLDADWVTRLRTAGMTAAAAEVLQPEPQQRLALIGSGFEASMHLRALARLWPLRAATVYSPNPQRRAAFAARHSEELGIEVEAVATSAEALAAAPTVLLATKASEPVVDGRDFLPGATVLSIGSTRPDLRELDLATLARAAVVVVDDPRSVLQESADIIEAVERGAITADDLLSIGAAVESDRALARSPERDLGVYKSVGTAVQDLALAGELMAAATARGMGRELGELTELKPAPPVRVALQEDVL